MVIALDVPLQAPREIMPSQRLRFLPEDIVDSFYRAKGDPDMLPKYHYSLVKAKPMPNLWTNLS
jgi:hypothetical protein